MPPSLCFSCHNCIHVNRYIQIPAGLLPLNTTTTQLPVIWCGILNKLKYIVCKCMQLLQNLLLAETLPLLDYTSSSSSFITFTSILYPFYNPTNGNTWNMCFPAARYLRCRNWDPFEAMKVNYFTCDLMNHVWPVILFSAGMCEQKKFVLMLKKHIALLSGRMMLMLFISCKWEIVCVCQL